MNIDSLIKNISDHYYPLSIESTADFKQQIKLLHIDKGTLLVKEGQYSDKIYYIGKGATRAYYLKDGKDITDWFAFENNFITAISSFFLNIPSPHFIEILEDSVLMEVSRSTMQNLSDKYLDFDRLGKVIITKTMLQLQQRIVSIQFESAQQKYDNLLALNPNIIQRISLTHIASYLGITLETLSRIRNPKNRI